jgi:hypothetical protein
MNNIHNLKKQYFAKLIGKFNGVVFTNHKLFLCSRDIQIGDKAQRYFKERLCNPTEILDVHGEKIMVDGGSFAPIWDDKKEFFKILGGISPNAKWIKDEDEFDVDELRWIWFPAYDEPEYYPLSEFTWEGLVKQRGGYKTVPSYLTPTIAIKCPCCEDYK